MPKSPPPACVACGGSGKSSKGGVCIPCRGTGDKQEESIREKTKKHYKYWRKSVKKKKRD